MPVPMGDPMVLGLSAEDCSSSRFYGLTWMAHDKSEKGELVRWKVRCGPWRSIPISCEGADVNWANIKQHGHY